MPVTCRTTQQAETQAKTGRRKKSWTEAERSDIRKRAEQRNALLEQLRKPYANEEADKAAQYAADLEGKYHEFTQLSGDMVSLSPNESYRLQSYLAKWFGMVRDTFGLGDDFTKPGAVRMNVIDMRRTAQGLVDVAGKWEVLGKLRRTQKEFQEVAKKYGIKGTQADELLQDIIEVGQTPRARLAYGNTDAVNAVLDKRYNEFVATTKALGFTEAELDRLVHLSLETSESFDKVRGVAKALGVDTGEDLTNIGYFARQFTDDASMRLDQVFSDVGGFVRRGVGTTPFAKSRSTWWLVPEDYHMLSEVATPGVRSAWNKWLREATGLEQSGLDNLGSALRKETNNADVASEVARRLGKTPEEVQRYKLSIKADKSLNDAVNAEVDRVIKLDPTKYTDPKLKAKLKYATRKQVEQQEFVKQVGVSLDEYNALVKEVTNKPRVKTPVTTDEVDAELARLTGLSPEEFAAKRDEVTKAAGGLTEREWDDLFQEPTEFLKYLDANFTGEQLDALVDAGVLSKVPMSSREVFDYWVKQYPLPYTSRSQLFRTNVLESLQTYRNSLRRAAADSVVFKRLVEDGTRKGWVVSPTQVLSDPETYKGFKKLDDIDMTRFATTPELVESFKGGYLHPVAFDQVQALVNLSTTPKSMHEFAQVLHWMNRMVNVGALLGSGVSYVSRVTLGNAVQYLGGGGHLHRVIPASVDVLKVMRGGLDALDDTHPFLMDGGTWLTKREAFKRFMVGRGTDAIPLESGERVGDVVASFNIFGNPVRAVQELVSYGQLFGDPVSGAKGVVGYAGRKLEKVQDKAFAPFAAFGNMSDLFFKWGLVTSTMKVHGVGDGVRRAHSLVSSNHNMTTMSDAFKHIDNYFIDYANLGQFQRAIGYIRPFASYAVSNPPMVLRHAMRNPSAFMSYMRLYSLLNRVGSTPDVTEAGFSKYELDQLPVSLHVDPDTKLATTMFTGNFDPYVDALQFFKQTGDQVARVTGHFAGSGYEQREQLSKPYSVTDFIGDLVAKNTNVWITAVSELKSGRDSFTGLELDKTKKDLFGVQVSPDVAWILGKFPLISSLDRALGGRGEVRDVYGKVLSPAQPGLLGTPQRPASRSEKTEFNTEQSLSVFDNQLRQALGVTVKTIDLKEGNQYTLNDVKKARGELRKAIIDKSALVRTNQTPKGVAELETMRAQYVQLSVDLWAVTDWMNKNKVPPSDVLKKLQSQNVVIRTLPVPSKVMEKYISEQVNEQRGVLTNGN